MRYKVAGPTSTVVLPGLTTLYRDSLLGGAGWSGYKVASPTSTVVFSRVLPGLATLYRNSLLGGAGWGIKWLVQLSFFQYLDRPLYTGISLLGGAGWSGYKVASPTSTVVFSVVFNLDWQLYRIILCSGALLGGAGWSGYKVASPTSTVVFSGFYLDWPLYTGFFARGSWMERV